MPKAVASFGKSASIILLYQLTEIAQAPLTGDFHLSSL
jgi:hypothetical protein